MKRPEYTAGVVSVYRKYLDRYLEKGREGWKVSREDYEELQALYNRGGFSRGYYQVHNGKELMSLSRPGHFDGKGKKELEKKREYEQLLLRLKKEFLEKCAALREVILVPTSGLSTVYAYDGGIVLAY